MTPDILIDAHLDIAMNFVAVGRDFRLASWQKRQLERKFPGHRYDGIGVATVGLPDMLLGRTGIVFGSIWVKQPNEFINSPAITYYEPRQAYEKALKQMDYYHRLADEDPRIVLIRSQQDLEDVLATWQPDTPFEEHRLGLVISMEGADPVLEPRQFEEWYERGVRCVGLAWRATRYAAGTGEPGRVTSIGHELMDVMADFGVLLDVSHLAEAAFYEALDSYPGQVMASHSNPRRFMNSDRNLSDDMLRRLVERDGVVGLIPYNGFMRDGWHDGDRKNEVTLNDYLDMIDHVCQVAGDALHVGIGTDWDGGFGWGETPLGFDTHLDLWNLRHILLQRYDEEDVKNILCGNVLRMLRRGL